MIRLTKEQIILLHTQLIKETGGRDGIRDKNLLESVIESILKVASGEKTYEALLEWVLEHSIESPGVSRGK